MSRRAVVFVILLGLVGGACAPSPMRMASRYETVDGRARRNTERAQRHNELGVGLLQEGDYVAAERELKKALAYDPMHGSAHNNLGKTYFHQRRFYLAAWEFQYAIKLMPDQPAPRNNLGMVFEAVGKLDRAAEAYTEAVDRAPDNTQFLGNLARTRLRQGDKSQAVRLLLEKLLMRETRPQWREWARERLAAVHFDPPSTTSPAATRPAAEPNRSEMSPALQ